MSSLDAMAIYKNLPIAERFLRWKEMIKGQTGPVLLQSLQNFVRLFPFNCEQWAVYAKMIQTIDGQSKAKGIWERALMANPYSVWLWKYYLLWARCNQRWLSQAIQQALKHVRYDFDSDWIYSYYINSQDSPQRLFSFYFQALSKPSRAISTLYQSFGKWFATINDSQLANVWKAHRREPIIDITKCRSLLRQQVQNKHKQSVLRVQVKQSFQDKLQMSQYAPNQDLGLWLEYIQIVKQNQDKEEIIFIYQKALITQNDQPLFWEKYIEFYEEFDSQSKLLTHRLRNIAPFITHFSSKLACLLAQLEEKQNVGSARQIYMSMHREGPRVDLMLRHIYMEIRAKEIINAKNLFEAALTIFQTESKQALAIILEYLQFAKKELKSLDCVRKIIKFAFLSQPFSAELVIPIIQFWQSIDPKDKRELRDHNDQITSFISKSLQKLNLPSQELLALKKLIIGRLRSSHPNIYTIKQMENTIMQAAPLHQ